VEPSLSNSTSDGAAEPGRLQFMLRALRYRNFRLFFAGQLVSLTGSWISMVASSWLVYRLADQADHEHAALMLGIVGFAGQIPIFLISPFAGVWVDHRSRHRILIVTQTLSMLQSFALAALVLNHLITIPQVIALNAFQGVVNAIDVPARQSFVIEMVENRGDLANAIALNSSMVHGSRLFGPAIAGVLIWVVGEGCCFLIDGISYAAVIAALVAMQVKPAIVARPGTRMLHSLKEGLRYSLGFPPIRDLLLLVGVTSLMVMSQSVLMPIFADKILGGGPRSLGVLLSATGVGAFCGSLYLASRRSVLGLGNIIAGACTILGASLLAFSFSRSMLFSLPLLFFSGCMMVVEMASANTVLQTLVDDDKRGRVMSLFTMAFLGVAPFGSLLAGVLASAIGAPHAMAICGAVCFAAGLVFAWRLRELRPYVRPIYVRKGIIPEVAEGMQSTAAKAASAPE
jgi:MFS family permease